MGDGKEGKEGDRNNRDNVTNSISINMKKSLVKLVVCSGIYLKGTTVCGYLI